MNKLSGIVLHSIKYGETSLIAHVYTNLLGRQTYMLNGVRGSASKQRSALIQPLFLLDIEAYPSRKNSTMCKAKEFKAAYPLQSLPFDVHKNVIALFMGEVLYRLVREEEQNLPLYNFLYNHVLLLDQMEKGVSNFHLYFLAQLAKHLGFFPGNTYQQHLPYFDMRQGIFVAFKPQHFQHMNKETSALLSELLEIKPMELHNIKLCREQREMLLRSLIDYYSTHLGVKNPIRSLSVLQEVFE